MTPFQDFSFFFIFFNPLKWSSLLKTENCEKENIDILIKPNYRFLYELSSGFQSFIEFPRTRWSNLTRYDRRNAYGKIVK